MGGSIGRISGNSYFKILFSGSVAVLCVAGGIYLGDAIVRRPEVMQSPKELTPAIMPGDLFPLLAYTGSGKETGSFESLLMGQNTVLLFLSSGCGRCDDQLDVWNREIQPILKSGVQVIVCVRDSALPPQLKQLIGPRRIVVPEGQVYEIVGLKVTPTVIGLDEYGLVVYIQPGYSEVFGREFYEHFAMTAE